MAEEADEATGELIGEGRENRRGGDETVVRSCNRFLTHEDTILPNVSSTVHYYNVIC